MTNPDDPQLIEVMWRATDLTRAYLAQDRTSVTACVADLDTERLERILVWLILDHDNIFDNLGEPSMEVREIDAVAALAPPEIELATTMAMRRVAAGEMGLGRAVESLAPLGRVHAITICTVVMMLDALGRTTAVELLDHAIAEFERTGYARPYTIT
ncbi:MULTISPECIES: hypothetical protein [Streptomycetaceae]|uniref:Uncharacterized protein n=1 Tax=Streptantibioticus cattleyicolor (strain ATCC 35852 / DSM 46488 / JCM 4925 / NBRC 14057 / NRRL 8057) TaxID=1003195 RepID=F8JT50_STREN|nr:MULTISPECIES: hypothetical protein [Streptomycetaceae]AEW92990.1 hypothetical protein SCATT_06190 [Streptantibioticus cattleyicolor NRRL 8057 = DSM 46488]MYS57729.1 hypothetical protein [Streptomyces sp. SID5468]CCB73348.1 protein of unknown function [Streptantibioticus cattleyicolor NRRL 8057 = DSM 46488]